MDGTEGISDLKVCAKSQDAASALPRRIPPRTPLTRIYPVWLVRGAWGILAVVVVGVTTAVLVSREIWVVYFCAFSIYPLRSLVRFYRKDPFAD